MFIVQTACDPVDRHLMELLIMINAARLASAKRITAVIPWYFYARQDKKSRPREPITARLVADMLQSAGVDRVLTMDLHAGQVQGFFHIPVDHMTAVPIFAQYIRDLNLTKPIVAVSPDTGRAKLAGKFAEMIGGDLVVLNKERPDHHVARVTTVIGDVAGKVVVMTDDIIDTAGTLVAGAAALTRGGRGQGLSPARRTPSSTARRSSESPSSDDRPARRHRHGPDRSAHEAGQHRGADRRRHARGDDPATSSRTTRSRRSSPARTSSSERTGFAKPFFGASFYPNLLPVQTRRSLGTSPSQPGVALATRHERARRLGCPDCTLGNNVRLFQRPSHAKAA